jgi:hypothetical protein
VLNLCSQFTPQSTKPYCLTSWVFEFVLSGFNNPKSNLFLPWSPLRSPFPTLMLWVYLAEKRRKVCHSLNALWQPDDPAISLNLGPGARERLWKLVAITTSLRMAWPLEWESSPDLIYFKLMAAVFSARMHPWRPHVNPNLHNSWVTLTKDDGHIFDS